MRNCLQNIITPPNPCLNSTTCDRWYSSDCVKINGTLTCGSFGVNPVLTDVLQGFCSAFTTIINELADCCTTTVHVHLTSAQILALNTTPIQVIPAPPIGKHTQLLGAFATLTFNSIPYGNPKDLVFIYSGASTSIGGNPNILGATSTKSSGFGTESEIIDSVTPGAALNVTVLGGNPVNGDSTLDLYITYKIITL